MRHLRSLLLLMALVVLSLAATAASEPPPEKVRALLQILSDPDVQHWIEQQRSAPAPDLSAQAATDQAAMAGQIDGIRTHLASIGAAIPKVSGALSKAAARMHGEMATEGVQHFLLLLAAFAALGFGVERLFWLVSGGVRRWIMASRLDSPAERLRAAAARFGFGASWIAAFAVGSIGAFLAFDWPPVLRDALLRLLVALVIVRMARVFGRVLFAPGGPRFRLLPMDTPSAWFWHRRMLANMVWVALQYALIEWLVGQQVDEGVIRVVAYGLYLVQLALVMEMVWRRPGPRDERHVSMNWFLTVSLVVLLLLRVVGAFPVFWLGTIALGLFGCMHLIVAIAGQLQRGPDAALGAPFVPSIGATAVVRAIRLVLIIAAGLLLAYHWGIPLTQLFTGSNVTARILRGFFSVVTIALFADLIWFVFKAMLERRLAQAQSVGERDAHAGQATRLRTVLPILRNVSFVTLALIAVLTALSALGVDIAPMVAGAGVLGIAVGFGAQTLVKDIVSGVFFLFD
ncbi:MAG: hypothetical protein ABI434_22395, partial [Burkholderiaceae bacterium]